MTSTFQQLSNYEKLLMTAESLKNSQGFYSRLYDTLLNATEDSINEINNIETLYSARDTLDVVFYLEG